MRHFRTINRDTAFLLPPSVDEWLPKRHLAMLLGLLVHGDATGAYSSRKLERARNDSVAFRFIAGNEHGITTRWRCSCRCCSWPTRRMRLRCRTGW